MPAACAVEMIHAYSLIHDDLPAMDDDDLRRGRPTCHSVFGEAMAILAGDALVALAFQVLAEGISPPAEAARCCAALAEAAGPCHLVGGQADDMIGLAPGDGLAALESMHLRKTGAMIRVALHLGALSAGASQQQLAALDVYGRAVGLAFQIADDLLDVRGDEAALGKRVGKDSAAGQEHVSRPAGRRGASPTAPSSWSTRPAGRGAARAAGDRAGSPGPVCHGKESMMDPLLSKIRSPQDLQPLSPKQLKQLADEMREAVCRLVGTRTAHFASNLGAVELALALHTDFRFLARPADLGHRPPDLSAQDDHRPLRAISTPSAPRAA